MASPTVAARTEYALTTAGTTATPTFTQTTDDLVVIFLSVSSSNNAITPGDGFTELDANFVNLHVIYKVLDGSEGGNVAITITLSKACALAYNIQGHDTGQAPEIAAQTLGTDTTPDPGTVTPTGGAKDYLWLAGFEQDGEEADDDTWCTAAPTNFTNLIQKTTGVGGAATSNSSIAAADFASNAASMNPATFTTAQSKAWNARTVAVHPAAPVDSIPHYRNPIFVNQAVPRASSY